jgi:hypothetical protein
MNLVRLWARPLAVAQHVGPGQIGSEVELGAALKCRMLTSSFSVCTCV